MRPVAPVEHTSAYALPSYCSGKVPLSHIFRAVETDERVCVWGIPDFHIVEYAYERGFIATHIETLSKRKSEPLLNRERPRLFRLQSIDDLALQTQRRGEAPGGIPCEASRGFLVLAVFPGCDYVFHYARMVMLVMESMRPGCSRALLEVRRFPALERSFVEWSGLAGVPIGANDIVVLGHVRDYFDRLRALDNAWVLGSARAVGDEDVERVLRESSALVSAVNARVLSPADFDAAERGVQGVRHTFTFPDASPEHRARVDSDSSGDDETGGASTEDGVCAPSKFPADEARRPPEGILPFLAWWRLFSPQATAEHVAEGPTAAAFVPSWHEDLVTELRQDPVWAAKYASGASTVDFLLHKQHVALSAALPSVLQQHLRNSSLPTSARSCSDPVDSFSFGLGVPLTWSGWAWERLGISHAKLQHHAHAHAGVLFLGFRYSYWGDICKPLAELIFRKTSSVIYAAKCGTLAGPESIHRVVAPHEFCRVSEPDSERAGRVTFVAPRPDSFTYVPRSERRIPVLNPLHSEIASGLVDLAGRASGVPAAAAAAHVATGRVAAYSTPRAERPERRLLKFGQRWLSSAVGAPYDPVGSRIIASGLHVSVPTLVGETYAQRTQIEAAAAQHFRRRRQIAMITGFARKEVIPPNTSGLKRCLRALLEDPEPRSFLEILRACMPFLRPPFRHALRVPCRVEADDDPGWSRDATEGDVFEELCRRDAEDEESQPHVLQLLSIDDETTWFAEAAAAAGGVFTALHRTTDYVRAEHHRATITKDDLSAEKGHSNSQRKRMIDAIAGIIYKLLRREVRYIAWPTLSDYGFDEAVQSLLFTRNDVGTASITVSGGLRWGVLGAAHIAPKFIASIRASGHSSLAVIASRDATRAEALLEHTGHAAERISILGSYDALLARADVDAVYVPLPNHLHVAWAIKAVAAGKHVLVEKPLGISASEVRQLRSAVEAQRVCGRTLHVAEAMLPMFHPLLHELRAELARQGGAVRARIVYHHALATDTIAYRSVEGGGGSLYALGCYAIALALALFGDLIPVAAAATSARKWSAASDDTGIRPPDVSFLAVVAGAPPAGKSVAASVLASPVVTLSCSIDDVPSCQSLTIACASGATVDVPRPFRPGFDPLPPPYARSVGDTAAALRVTRPGFMIPPVSASSAVAVAPTEPEAAIELEEPIRYLECESAFASQLLAFERSALSGAPAAYALAESEKAAALVESLRALSCQ